MGNIFQEQIWVGMVIGLVGVLLLILLFAVAFCTYRWCKKRRAHSYSYLNYQSPLHGMEDSISYRSLEIQDPTSTSAANDGSSSLAPNNTASVSLLLEPNSTSGGGGGGRGGAGRESSVYEAFERARVAKEMSSKEAALMNCRYYLRNVQHYALLQQLTEMGSRVQKNWFLVRPTGSGHDQSLLLTMCPTGKAAVKLESLELQTLNHLLKSLRHPYIFPIWEVDHVPEKQLVVCVQPLCNKGSLKDIIYGSRPVNEWTMKYSLKKNGLSSSTIALYGRQILEAVVFLYKKGFPPLGHLHTGNVIVDGKCCRLSGLENVFLGYKTRNYRMLADYHDSIDVIMFGHLLFEMMCGCELTSALPSTGDYQKCEGDKQLLEVLKFIFQADSENMPAVKEILAHPFFQSVSIPELRNWDPEDVKISSDGRMLLKSLSHGKPSRGGGTGIRRKRTGVSSSLAKRDSQLSANGYQVTPAKAPPSISSINTSTPSNPLPPSTSSSKKTATVAQQRHSSSIPHPPSSHPPKPRPPPSSSDRGTLLKDIHKGKKLKKTVTNDRSAPRI